MELFAATALVLRVPLAPFWPSALLLLLALTAGAVFASMVNDIFDLPDDLAGGKRNAVLRLPRAVPALVIAAAAAIGIVIAWRWRDEPLLSLVYVAAWLAFVAYSAPPLRLKKRGGWGVLAMGIGEAALPSLVAALLCTRAAAAPIDPLWMTTVGVWGLCHGLRAILWHQLGDREPDAQAAVDTFVNRRGAAFVRGFARRWLFPLELAALAAMLVQMGSVLPFLGLALYLAAIPLRMRLWNNVPVVVDPVRDHYLLLQDFYLCHLPLTILLACTLRHLPDALALLVFLLLFPRAPLRVAFDALRLALAIRGEIIARGRSA
jgi:hypothetical protein